MIFKVLAQILLKIFDRDDNIDPQGRCLKIIVPPIIEKITVKHKLETPIFWINSWNRDDKRDDKVKKDF